MLNLNNVLSKNQSMVIDAFNNGKVDEQHFESGYEIDKFSAVVYFNDEENNNIIEKLCTLPISPERILVWNSRIEIHWTPRLHQCIENRDQYLNLALDFAKFIDEIEINDLEVNIYSFWDDAYLIPDDESNKINYTPKFNVECFGWYGKPDIYRFD